MACKLLNRFLEEREIIINKQLWCLKITQDRHQILENNKWQRFYLSISPWVWLDGFLMSRSFISGIFCISLPQLFMCKSQSQILPLDACLLLPLAFLKAAGIFPKPSFGLRLYCGHICLSKMTVALHL